MTISTRRISSGLRIKQALNRLCAEAVQQQILQGDADDTQLRNRRRHLAKQVCKRIPVKSYQNSREFLYAASIVLALSGFSGLVMPQQALAEPVFKHVMLNGFDVGSGAAPAFADIDGDGDLDVFVGEINGTVKFYRNTGSSSAPVFTPDAVNNPLAGFYVGSFAIPTFADIDGDGDLDVFVGEGSGTVKFYRNTGSNITPVFTPDAANNPMASFDVGTDSAPTFADIDNDGDLDAFIGEEFGTVKFYRNTGSNSAPVFIPDTGNNPLAGVNVSNYAVPTFADLDSDGDLDAFVGDRSGKVKYYRNTGSNILPVFTPDVVNNPLAVVDVNFAAVPAFADIDDDGDLDAFIGDPSGSVRFYPNKGIYSAPVFTVDTVNNPLAGYKVIHDAAPSFADIDGDSDLDVFVGVGDGTVSFYRNTGSNSAPVFMPDAVNNPLAGFDVGRSAKPTFGDIDGDGDLDAFVGTRIGSVSFYRNTGTNNAPFFTPDTIKNPLASFNVGTFSAPTFADIDGDGDLDVFVGEEYGTVKFYRNTGTSTAPVFMSDTVNNPLAGFNVGYDAAPTFADLDGDGDLDAFVGEDRGTVKFYRNTGTSSSPVFTPDPVNNPLAGFFVGQSAKPTFADLDGDGDLDAFIGEIGGTVRFFENFDPTSNSVTKNDFNGDGKSDILIRNLSGFLSMYEMDGAMRRLSAIGGLLNDWTIEGTGDFGGDRKADILIRNGNGFLAMYQMDGASRILFPIGGLPLDWNVEQVGDFNGNGKADILIRNGSGFLSMYQMDGANRTLIAVGGLPLNWSVEQVDDFNGDGRADILIRSDNGFLAMYQMDGASRTLLPIGGLPLAWNVEQVGDFNGDGKADILIRNGSGFLAMYQMDGANRTLLPVGGLPLDWNVQQVSDFNGDGKADILIRNGSGFLAMYQMDGVSRTLNAVGGLPTVWDVLSVGLPQM
ncbi:MAG: VCBS repeat-containing protein [Methylococcaceae bacterium]|nr:VCBS repeat-containing protein [Methylococcaceae bacterium]